MNNPNNIFLLLFHADSLKTIWIIHNQTTKRWDEIRRMELISDIIAVNLGYAVFKIQKKIKHKMKEEKMVMLEHGVDNDG